MKRISVCSTVEGARKTACSQHVHRVSDGVEVRYDCLRQRGCE